MTVPEFRERLADLVKVVSQGHKRVEIAIPTGDVVLISRTEIEALERALNIMAETAEFKAIAHSLHRIAAATVEQPVVA
jgi:PHD/YefM family antitoxin component YafN of YafNO toxin-antitoxin module